MKKNLFKACLLIGLSLGMQLRAQTVTTSTTVQRLVGGVLQTASTTVNAGDAIAFPWVANANTSGAGSGPMTFTVNTATLPAGASNFVWSVSGDLTINGVNNLANVTIGTLNKSLRTSSGGAAIASDLGQSKGRLNLSYTFTPVGTGGPCTGVVSTGGFSIDLFKKFNATTAPSVPPIVGPNCLEPNRDYTYSVDPIMTDNIIAEIGVDKYVWDVAAVIVNGGSIQYNSVDNSSITIRTGNPVPASSTMRCYFGVVNSPPTQTTVASQAYSTLGLQSGTGAPTVTLSGAATGTINPSTSINAPSKCIPTTATGTGSLTFTVTQQGTATYSWSFGTYNGDNPSNLNGWNTNPPATGNLPYTKTGTSLVINNIQNQPGTVKLTVFGCGAPITYTYHINRSHSQIASVTLGPNCINPGPTGNTVAATLAANANQNVLNWAGNANFTFPVASNGTTITATNTAIPNSYSLPVSFLGCSSPTQSYTVNIRPTSITNSPVTLCIPRNSTPVAVTFTPTGTSQYSYSVTGAGNTLNGATLTSVSATNNVVNIQRTTTAAGGNLTATFTAAAGCAFTAPVIPISTVPVVPTVTPPSCVNGNVPSSNALININSHLGVGTYTVNFVSGQTVLVPSGSYTPNGSNDITVPVSQTVIGIGTYTVTHTVTGCGTPQTSAQFTIDNQTGRPTFTPVPSGANLLVIPNPALPYRYINCTTGLNLPTNGANQNNPINLIPNPTAQWTFTVASGTGNSLGFEGTISSGCVQRVCTTINYSNRPGRGGVESTLDSKFNLPLTIGKIYPNPNDGKFILSLNKELEIKNSRATLYDAKGMQVFELLLENGDNKIDQKLLPGTYTLVCTVNGQNYVDRVVVK